MKVVKFENKDSKEKKEYVNSVLEEIKHATNFIFLFSTDKLNTIEHISWNVTNLQSIGMLDIAKHSVLHDVYPYDDDGEKEDIPVEGGI